MTNTRKSGYEKAMLFELYIARAAAWLFILAMIVVVVLQLLGIMHVALFPLAVAVVLLVFSASVSAKCEYRAQGELAEIWRAERPEQLNAES